MEVISFFAAVIVLALMLPVYYLFSRNSALGVMRFITSVFSFDTRGEGGDEEAGRQERSYRRTE